jgi:hypothetical protein
MGKEACANCGCHQKQILNYFPPRLLPAFLDRAPPGPIKTKWGLGFRDYDECVKYIHESNSIKAPEGGLALPLPCTVYERPSYSVVPSNALWRDPERADVAAILRQSEAGNRRRDLYFPQVLRDARRIGEYYPKLR